MAFTSDMMEKGADESHTRPVDQKSSDSGAAIEQPVLSHPHHEYLLRRHGTLDLEPMPSHHDEDPYNWPSATKVLNLFLVAFHALMGTFSAASIIPAYSDIAADLGVTVDQVTYLTSVVIITLGVAPLLWRPLANTYGRRPIFLLSLLISCMGNIGCAKSSSYGMMMFFRAVVGWFISPAGSIGSAVVSEMFFRRERARYIGVWVVMVTLGVPVAPLIFGFVIYRVGYRWVYWILAMINAVELILYFFVGTETLFIAPKDLSQSTIEKPGFLARWFGLQRINPRPLRFYDFVEPIRFAAKPCVLLPACAYAMTFLFGSVIITVELPQLLEQQEGLNTEQLGLQFLGVIIGSLVGEQIGGRLSDRWMGLRRAPARPEWRLWLSYSGYALAIAGVTIFLYFSEHAPGYWTVTPIVGTALAAGGNQIVTTVLVTYAIDCCAPRHAASVGVFITLVRQIWGFIGPFWFPALFANVGVSKSAGVIAALIVGVSVFPTVLLQMVGPRWRRNEDDEEVKQ